jgi:hypothetical protein
MPGMDRALLRIKGSGKHLRVRLRSAPSSDPLASVRECCRAATALDKAMGEAVLYAVAAGQTWSDVGRALGLPPAESAAEVLEGYVSARTTSTRRFWRLYGHEE